jgi:hypothetical protein
MRKPLPWTNSEIAEYETLVNPQNAFQVILPPPPANSLAGLLALGAQFPPKSSTLLNQGKIDPIVRIIGDPAALGTTKEERYKSYLKHIWRNSYARWLKSDSHFKKAYDQFKKKQKKSRIDAYRAESAELQFLYLANFIGIFAIAKQRGVQPRDPTSRQVSQAITRIKALKASLADGVQYESYFDTQNLKSLLEKLLTKLNTDQKEGYRKPHSDKDRLGRSFVSYMTRLFITHFNEASPTLVICFARAMGYDADETAIKRRISQARKTYNQQLAKANREKVAKALQGR